MVAREDLLKSTARYAARPGKGYVAFSLATLRKGYFGSSGPRYEAHFEDGEVLRLSFWQARDKPYNFALGRKMATRARPDKKLVRGFVWHDAPGEPFRYVEDPMQDATAKPVRVNYKTLLSRLIEAVDNDNLEDLKVAYQDARQAVA